MKQEGTQYSTVPYLWYLSERKRTRRLDPCTPKYSPRVYIPICTSFVFQVMSGKMVEMTEMKMKEAPAGRGSGALEVAYTGEL